MRAPPGETNTLFDGDHVALGEKGVVVEDGAVLTDSSGLITIAMQNYGCEPVCLEEGQPLGHTVPAAISSPVLVDIATHDPNSGTTGDGELQAICKQERLSKTDSVDHQRLERLQESL